MIILDLCGGTGSWSRPYKEAGYEVYVVTLPEYDVFDIVLSNDNVYLKNRNGVITEIHARDVYGILAAPTCTMFSLARTTAKLPRDFKGAIALVQKCLEVVWYCRQQPDSKLKFWALENPLGYLRQFIGRPSYTFSPEEFGECYTKKTDLWGYFNEPKKNPRKQTPDEHYRSIRNNRVLPDLPEGYEMPKGWNVQAARRSMTSAKFADAFYAANK